MNWTQILLNSNFPIRELTEAENSALKSVLLEMFCDIQVACEREGLVVMLGGGSCLGAVRHKGFIPWDDDLDLNMLRADYDAFPEALEKHFPGKYRLIGPGVSDRYSLPFTKIEKKGTVIRTVYECEEETPAIGIDLFPIENVPDRMVLRLWHGFWSNFYRYVAVCTKQWQLRACPGAEFLLSRKEGRKFMRTRFFIGRLFSFRSYQKWYEICDRIARKYKNAVTKFVTVPTGRMHYFGEIQKRSDIMPPAECEFEGRKAYICNGYETYLSSLYGDYMQVPPPEKREKHFIVEIDFGG